MVIGKKGEHLKSLEQKYKAGPTACLRSFIIGRLLNHVQIDHVSWTLEGSSLAKVSVKLDTDETAGQSLQKMIS